MHYALSKPINVQQKEWILSGLRTLDDYVLLWFINCNRWTIVVEHVDNEGYYASVGAKGTWEISVPYSRFYFKHKTTLQK